MWASPGGCAQAAAAAFGPEHDHSRQASVRGGQWVDPSVGDQEPVDSAAPVENVDSPAIELAATGCAAGGGPVHVPHRRLENSLREFPTLCTGSTTTTV